MSHLPIPRDKDNKRDQGKSINAILQGDKKGNRTLFVSLGFDHLLGEIIGVSQNTVMHSNSCWWN